MTEKLTAKITIDTPQNVAELRLSDDEGKQLRVGRTSQLTCGDRTYTSAELARLSKAYEDTTVPNIVIPVNEPVRSVAVKSKGKSDKDQSQYDYAGGLSEELKTSRSDPQSLLRADPHVSQAIRLMQQLQHSGALQVTSTTTSELPDGTRPLANLCATAADTSRQR